jgi:hypothetical protein
MTDAVPWESGHHLEVLSRVKRVIRLKHWPVIMLSSHAGSPFVAAHLPENLFHAGELPRPAAG